MSGKRREVARRPAESRTIVVRLNGGSTFDGWEATFRRDFPARYLEELQSGDLARIMAVVDALIVDHNMPDERGELAANIRAVDPLSGLLALVDAFGEQFGKLPPR